MSKEKEKNNCGSCCWFYGELTDGWGQCMRQDICDSMHCTDLCTTDKYISKEKVRHSAAVLARFKRAVHNWDEKVVNIRPKESEIDEAIEIVARYINVITKKV
jgi:hypothetical protein